jgi:hypothetical protein
MSKQDAANFDWHVVVGDREMCGTARTAAERDVRQNGDKDLMDRDPQAGTAKAGA